MFYSVSFRAASSLSNSGLTDSSPFFNAKLTSCGILAYITLIDTKFVPEHEQEYNLK